MQGQKTNLPIESVVDILSNRPRPAIYTPTVNLGRPKSGKVVVGGSAKQEAGRAKKRRRRTRAQVSRARHNSR